MLMTFCFSSLARFNPRARDGREAIKARQSLSILVSIHAPVMDAKRTILGASNDACFNPRARDGREYPLWIKGHG